MGGHFACFSVFFALVVITSIVAVDFNEPRLLPDGILITGGTTDRAIRNVVGTWSLHVVVDTHKPNDRLHEQVQKLSEMISAVTTTRSADNGTKALWLTRLRLIDARLPRLVASDQRRRRGLLDVGGILLHQLFGVATSSDIKISRHLIAQVRNTNKKVLHKANELVSIVNQTYQELSLHQAHLNDIEKALTEIYAKVGQLHISGNIALERMRVSLSIDRRFSLLENRQMFWQLQQGQYLKERAGLESGRLMESIMPRSELTIIVQACHVQGFSVPSLEWIYEFVNIRPLWKADGVLMYTAHLPLTDNKEYLRYHLYTWPSVPKSANFTVELETPTDIAYDTESGNMYIPQSCVGQFPEVCQSGPRFNKGGLQCPRGILTNDEELRKTCHVTIRANVKFNPIKIQQITANMFVMCSKGEKFDILCPRKASRSTVLPHGVSVIHVRPGCKLAGATWSLTGMVVHKVNISLRPATVMTVPFNWSRMISHRVIYHKLKAPTWRVLPEIKHVRLSHLHDDGDEISWPSDQPFSITWWPIVVLCCLPLVVQLLLFNAYQRKWFCFKTKPNSSKPQSTDLVPSPHPTFEMVPLNTHDCVSAMQAHVQVITPSADCTE